MLPVCSPTLENVTDLRRSIVPLDVDVVFSNPAQFHAVARLVPYWIHGPLSIYRGGLPSPRKIGLATDIGSPATFP